MADDATVATLTPSTPPRFRAEPGAVIDGFRIERLIGAGAMGTVFLAHDPAGREVALKFGEPDATETWTRRFEREAHALASLKHPNVVVVHRVGRVDKQVYIAMEYVPANAREWLAAAPRSWRDIVAMYAAAGDGLAAAHAAGFVHRDFKPDNVLVGADGRPRVADFGLVTSTSEVLPATVFQRLTHTGVAIGTPSYMAPEQLASEPTDARADQFSLCAALWEALFGEPPFGRGPMVAVMVEIARGPVQAPADARGVPAPIVAALLRGLSLVREQRFPSVTALLAELRPPARRRRTAAIAGAGLAVAAAGIAIAVGSSSGDKVTPAAAPPPVDAAPRRTKLARWIVRGTGTAGDLRYDPKAIDLTAFMAWASAAVKADVPDAFLVRMSVDAVARDGSVDLSRVSSAAITERPSQIELRYASRARKQLAECGVRVYASMKGIRIVEVGECDDPPVRTPRCTIPQVWTRYLATKPSDPSVARFDLDYFADDDGQPLWVLRTSTTEAHTIDDAC